MAVPQSLVKSLPENFRGRYGFKEFRFQEILDDFRGILKFQETIVQLDFSGTRILPVLNNYGVIGEVSKRRALKSLNEDILKITILKTNTPYPSKKIWRLRNDSEEEEAEAMEQYMSKTRTDYESGVARPKIDNKDQFELKRQFLKELRENTFSSSDNEDENEHIEKVLEIVDLFHVLNSTVDQQKLRVFLISLN
ncbi:hypothetical protein Tco_0747819 [Tanacetum coccineum]|uniref:Uncharacterized protein n=1 Tax=Tanacetum coccineum TaxID=301880 RepID=A0ABQ4YXA2_9ASTR